MASIKRPDESTLTAAMRLVTGMLSEYSDNATMAVDQPPIDCDALLDMIEAAQRIHTKFCPILREPE